MLSGLPDLTNGIDYLPEQLGLLLLGEPGRDLPDLAVPIIIVLGLLVPGLDERERVFLGLGLLKDARIDMQGVPPRNGKNRTLRANDGGGKQPCRRDPLETRRFRAVSPRFEARRKAHVSRQVSRSE